MNQEKILIPEPNFRGYVQTAGDRPGFWVAGDLFRNVGRFGLKPIIRVYREYNGTIHAFDYSVDENTIGRRVNWDYWNDHSEIFQIWEGDIVETEFGKFVAEYNGSEMVLKDVKGEIYNLHGAGTPENVIGNIYEPCICKPEDTTGNFEMFEGFLACNICGKTAENHLSREIKLT